MLGLVRKHEFPLVDITGGSPELHPDIPWFLDELHESDRQAQLRTNFLALVEPQNAGLMDLLGRTKTRLVGSMPCYLEENVDAQRGTGTYRKCVEIIRSLNEVGYGVGEDLPLNLVYNPAGAFLPGPQADLEVAYKEQLEAQHGIQFSHLLVITNMPIGRFERLLEERGEADEYRRLLRGAFNSETLDGLMCRHQVCVDWDGTLYDCDFNLALGMPVNHGAPAHVSSFDWESLAKRRVVVDEHCFGCTAGAGSSCRGELA